MGGCCTLMYTELEVASGQNGGRSRPPSEVVQNGGRTHVHLTDVLLTHVLLTHVLLTHVILTHVILTHVLLTLTHVILTRSKSLLWPGASQWRI